MNPQIFFSVIIPTYNRADFIGKAVDSVLAQTCGEFELIIIDDGSADDTKEIIDSYADKRLKYFFHDNKGVSFSRNKGLSLAKGNFIAFLDSDDWWKEDKLEKTLQYIRKYPDIHMFHTEEVWYRRGELLEQLSKHRNPTGRVYKNVLPLCCISISTAAIKKTVFEDIGIFDESFEACEDYDFWLRAASKYEVMLIPEDLTFKDGGRPDQLSSSVWGLDRFRIKAMCKMLDKKTLSDADRAATIDELNKKCGIFSSGCEKHGKTGEAEYYRTLPDKYS